MQVYLIEDKKKFMTELLVGSSFDGLLLSEGSIGGRGMLSVTGTPAEGFFDDGQTIDPSGYLPYGMYRETLFSFIKGDRTPVRLMMQLILPRERVESMTVSAESTIPSASVESLSILIRFRDGVLTVTGGTSVSGFYPDKSLEKELDKYVGALLDKIGVAYSEQL